MNWKQAKENHKLKEIILGLRELAQESRIKLKEMQEKWSKLANVGNKSFVVCSSYRSDSVNLFS